MATCLARTPEQWIGGEFNFDDWLSDCLLTGHIEKVDTDPESRMVRPHTGRPGS